MTEKKDWLDGYDPVAEGEQDERGTDLVGIRHNLSLSIEQRIEQHRRAAASILWLTHAFRTPGSSSNRQSA